MKYITMTQEIIEQTCADLRTRLAGMSTTVDKLDVVIATKYKVAEEDKPTVIVSAVAERKMKALVNKCLQEVAWNGTVSHDVESNTYVIEDIFVFPQEVSAATAVSTDDYGLWLMNFDTESFNKLRFHGHSHVNMATSPSLTDTNFRTQMMTDVQDFYIFAIYNKRADFEICIYDVTNNRMYETADIYYDSEATEVLVWADQQITENVKTKVFTPVPTTYSPTQYSPATKVTNLDKATKDLSAKPKTAKEKKEDKETKKRRDLYNEIQREQHPELFSSSPKPRNKTGTQYEYKGYYEDEHGDFFRI